MYICIYIYPYIFIHMRRVSGLESRDILLSFVLCLYIYVCIYMYVYRSVYIYIYICIIFRGSG